MRVHCGAPALAAASLRRARDFARRPAVAVRDSLRIKREIVRIEAGTFLNPKSWGASTHHSEEKKNAYLPCDCGSRRDDDRRGHCATGQP
jgi:hypothetical protein